MRSRPNFYSTWWSRLGPASVPPRSRLAFQPNFYNTWRSRLGPASGPASVPPHFLQYMVVPPRSRLGPRFGCIHEWIPCAPPLQKHVCTTLGQSRICFKMTFCPFFAFVEHVFLHMRSVWPQHCLPQLMAHRLQRSRRTQHGQFLSQFCFGDVRLLISLGHQARLIASFESGQFPPS